MDFSGTNIHRLAWIGQHLTTSHLSNEAYEVIKMCRNLREPLGTFLNLAHKSSSHPLIWTKKKWTLGLNDSTNISPLLNFHVEHMKIWKWQSLVKMQSNLDLRDTSLLGHKNVIARVPIDKNRWFFACDIIFENKC